jgi:hypothetical protein
MIIILNISADKFSLNGIPYFKNFMPHVLAGKLKIVNIYDTKFNLTEFYSFNNYSVDGVIYTNLSDLQNALLPVLYTRNTLNPNSYFPKHNDLVGLNEGIDFLHINKVEKDKLINLSGINTGDQDLSPYALVAYVEQQIGNIQEILSSDNLDLDTFQEIVDEIEKIQNQINNVSVNDATTLAKGIIKLSGDLSGTADAPTVPGLANKLTATLATDAEAQITAAVAEDSKVISRLKLFNWWIWQKTRAQVFSSSVQAQSFNTGSYVDLSLYYATFTANASKRIQIDAVNSRILGQNGSGTNSIYFSPTTASVAQYIPNSAGNFLLDSTLNSVRLTQFQKSSFEPLYIRVNNFTSDVLEDLRINVASGNNRPFFERCIAANASKGGGTWERTVSTVKINNTGVVQAGIGANTAIDFSLSGTSFNWEVDSMSSKSGSVLSEMISNNKLKDVDDKTANFFRVTMEFNYAAGGSDGTVDLAIVNPANVIIDQESESINVDAAGGTSKISVFRLFAVKTSDNNVGYTLRMTVGVKALTGWRIKNILRTNN